MSKRRCRRRAGPGAHRVGRRAWQTRRAAGADARRSRAPRARGRRSWRRPCSVRWRPSQRLLTQAEGAAAALRLALVAQPRRRHGDEAWHVRVDGVGGGVGCGGCTDGLRSHELHCALLTLDRVGEKELQRARLHRCTAASPTFGRAVSLLGVKGSRGWRLFSNLNRDEGTRAGLFGRNEPS